VMRVVRKHGSGTHHKHIHGSAAPRKPASRARAAQICWVGPLAVSGRAPVRFRTCGTGSRDASGRRAILLDGTAPLRERPRNSRGHSKAGTTFLPCAGTPPGIRRQQPVNNLFTQCGTLMCFIGSGGTFPVVRGAPDHLACSSKFASPRVHRLRLQHDADVAYPGIVGSVAAGTATPRQARAAGAGDRHLCCQKGTGPGVRPSRLAG
jgi:hypothetical protein